jgi:NADPH:quinone reductase-like Zn-dependent oxidoreductase
VWKVSKSLDLKDVAAMGVSYGTAWVSLTRRANVQAGCVRNSESTLGRKRHRTRVQKGGENSVVSPNLYLETDNPSKN